MKTNNWMCLIAMVLRAGLAIPVQLAAQEQQRAPVEQPFQRYTVTDLGTLGGTFSFGVGITNKSWVAGFSPLPGDLNQHAFVWRNGKITDLGTLGGPTALAAEFTPRLRRYQLAFLLPSPLERRPISRRFSKLVISPLCHGNARPGALNDLHTLRQSGAVRMTQSPAGKRRNI